VKQPQARRHDRSGDRRTLYKGAVRDTHDQDGPARLIARAAKDPM
jgi:hypothetical protein